MSFLTDLFEGNLNKLGTDITHAPSSLIAHPDELAETLGGAALVALPFAAPAIGDFLGIGAGEALSGASAVDEGLFGITGPGLGMDVLADPAITAFEGSDALLGSGAALPEGSTLASLNSGVSGFNVPGEGFINPSESAALPAGTTVNDIPVSGTTPSGFAPTDTELSGGLTGTAPSASPLSGAGGGGGFTNTLNSFLSSPYTKIAAGVAPLALTLGMGQPGLPASAQQLQGQAQALSQQGQADLASARAGQLNAGQTAQLGQMRSDLLNQWRQVLFNQGVQDPTKDARWPQIQAQIDSQVTQQTGTMIQQNITNALAETGQASTALTSIAQMQLASDQNFTNNLIGATKSLGVAAGLSSGTKVTIG